MNQETRIIMGFLIKNDFASALSQLTLVIIMTMSSPDFDSIQIPYTQEETTARKAALHSQLRAKVFEGDLFKIQYISCSLSFSVSRFLVV